MKISEEEKIILTVSGLSLGVLIYVFYFFLKKEDQTVFNALSLFGILLTIVGVWMGYSQIRIIKTTTDATKEAIGISFKRFNYILSVAELAKGSKLCQEIQYYLRDRKHELAVMRMQDLHELLIVQINRKDLDVFFKRRSFKTTMTDLSIHINNINDLLLKRTNSLDFPKIFLNLQIISNTLLEIENQIKSKDYDT